MKGENDWGKAGRVMQIWQTEPMRSSILRSSQTSRLTARPFRSFHSVWSAMAVGAQAHEHIGATGSMLRTEGYKQPWSSLRHCQPLLEPHLAAAPPHTAWWAAG